MNQPFNMGNGWVGPYNHVYPKLHKFSGILVPFEKKYVYALFVYCWGKDPLSHREYEKTYAIETFFADKVFDIEIDIDIDLDIAN